MMSCSDMFGAVFRTVYKLVFKANLTTAAVRPPSNAFGVNGSVDHGNGSAAASSSYDDDVGVVVDDVSLITTSHPPLDVCFDSRRDNDIVGKANKGPAQCSTRKHSESEPPAPAAPVKLGGVGLQRDNVTPMSTFCSSDEDWSRLHDIHLSGQLLEYVGRGNSINDIGLAQARHPLTTRYHYFEVQIIDPGENCFIAVGVARKGYPRRRHPGWNKGSVAYHADDGKMFAGSGVGEPFGPQCSKGDLMGCGILFPRDYHREWDENDDEAFRSSVTAAAADDDDENDAVDDVSDDASDNDVTRRGRINGCSSSLQADKWRQKNLRSGTKVQVFFTRNGNTVGKREVRIPKGGFYPTIGMLSKNEKVRVNLRPLTG